MILAIIIFALLLTLTKIGKLLFVANYDINCLFFAKSLLFKYILVFYCVIIDFVSFHRMQPVKIQYLAVLLLFWTNEHHRK
jgi:hypothetical protein